MLDEFLVTMEKGNTKNSKQYHNQIKELGLKKRAVLVQIVVSQHFSCFSKVKIMHKYNFIEMNYWNSVT